MSHIVLKDGLILLGVDGLPRYGSSPPATNCCCGVPCTSIGTINTTQPRMRIINSTCDGQCDTGGFDQDVPFSLAIGTSRQWSLGPGLSYSPGTPAGPTSDDCQYCQYVGEFQTIYYSTGLLFSLACVSAGEHAGKWRLDISCYRRGDGANPCGDSIGSSRLSTQTTTVYLTGLTKDVNNYLIGGPYTVNLPVLTHPFDGWTASACSFEVLFGP